MCLNCCFFCADGFICLKIRNPNSKNQGKISFKALSFQVKKRTKIVPVIYQPDFSPSESFSSPYPTHSSEREITPPNSQTRGMTLGASVDALDTSPSKFSLPSPSKSYDEFNSEEAELRDLVNEAGLMFPKDLSFGRPISRSSLSDDEMFQAANSIQCAMSDFVNQAVNIKIPK